MASQVKGGASPKSGTLSLSELQAFNKLYPKDRRLSTKELKAIADGIREINMNMGGSAMKKKTKYMAKGGYGTATKKMNVNKPKATKMMGGGYAMKKKK